MKLRLFFLIAVFALFTFYTMTVVGEHTYLGFVDVGLSGGWATQITIDLVIALTAFAVWMFGDAKERGLPAWIYFIAILTTGSIGALAYLIHRTIKELQSSPARRAAAA